MAVRKFFESVFKLDHDIEFSQFHLFCVIIVDTYFSFLSSDINLIDL